MKPAAGRASLLGWLDHPGEGGIHAADEADAWVFSSYATLADRVPRAARHLIEGGLQRGDVVTILVRSATDFVVAFFAVLFAGGVPSPSAPPLPLQDRSKYRDRLTGVIRAARPRRIIADEHLLDHAREVLTDLASTATAQALVTTGTPLDGPMAGADLALLQFTSGSSGDPRGIPISVANLESHLGTLARWLDMGPWQLGATWLPLYHDMGLIGSCLLPTVTGMPFHSMRPDQFIRSPRRWLECHGRHGATITAAPTFGLSYTLRRLKPGDLAGMDFSAWQSLVVGAERVDAAVLKSFTEILAPYGFRDSTYRPAYGLAEATLGLTGRVAGQPLPVVKVNRSAFSMGQPVEVLRHADIASCPVDDGTAWMVSCGPPVEGAELRVVDDSGNPLADGVLGEVEARGPSVAARYVGGEGSQSGTRFLEGRLLTGDAGFFVDGELYVVGRIGESIKVRGRHIYAEDLEATAAGELQLSDQRVAAVLGLLEGRAVARLVLAVPWAEGVAAQAVEMMQREVGDYAEVEVTFVASGAIPRTSSGKVRRRELWQLLAEGTLSVRTHRE